MVLMQARQASVRPTNNGDECSSANYTLPEVRFKNQGLEAIEVQDNGGGISSDNYETLALKHYTSKLSTYSDLTTLQTFGFRGEALSSLCALSKFSVITCVAEDAPKGTKLEFEVSGALKRQSVVAAQKGTTVSVENLFNNLPVRRRELERNIKREWNRVVGVLGQYACIQTGIKFSVTQQAGKGKKTTLFSTKGNQSTRENLVNVFGAKTLTALITMDLNLELEPTSAPSQRWSTQEDGGTKEIRIIGHISRPASGEGRQTPDRQMFFVNARPCGLPQVSKAFNEVYRSYNASQSPFIFANIELDTHMYDVNVSPDKRTILLHDQTRMLENLKVALTELFESQDYTVPISQLPAQRQPSYKQLTISRENTVTSKSPTPGSSRGRAQSMEDEESEAGSKARSARDDFSEDEGVARKSTKIGGRAVSRESLHDATGTVSLISNWMGRKAEDRVEPRAGIPKTTALAQPEADGLSKDKRLLIEKLRKEGENTSVEKETSDTPESSIVTTQATQIPSFHVPRPVADFNQRMAELQQPHQKPTMDEVDGALEDEEPIPSLPSPTKPTPSIADRFSSSVRIPRAPAEIATITIGDQTISSSIGTPCPKRARTMDPPSRSRSGVNAQEAGPPLPSFGSRLSQKFAAPGTASQPESDDQEEADEGVIEDTLTYDPDDALPDSPNDDLDKSIEEEPVPDLPEEEEVDLSMLDPNTAGDDQYIDEDEEKALEATRVEDAIKHAEESAQVLSQENEQRAKLILKGTKKKDSTLNLTRVIQTSPSEIQQEIKVLQEALSRFETTVSPDQEDGGLDSEEAEEKLSLTISKADFAKMKVVGQFNLGFILATRASQSTHEDGSMSADDLFIIDQHASDEKYNFERLQSTTIVQSQRLVHPKTLELTAMEEEIVLENQTALETNGFILTVDESGESPVGSRCQLVALPLSRETTFSLQDLEELISLLADAPQGSVPRPSKVRKMFAMRACRSSIMIGKTLTQKQMGRVVRHLGELDKPWNCPHGRPTMRHLCGLGVWDEFGWREGDEPDGEKDEKTDWGAYVRAKKQELEVGSEDETDDEEQEEE